ncbi:hypothetical protein [Sinorhizobium psoraleae]|uniref:Uncharacterized protein n=1 Tax=Sinorhizobium psoraleae TaxID=520838 RepID=A0ABT4KB83_9HYPH|nr:hypothetical protein [Sinorhizobium psoraleae]MCZ4089085.1 hypothetical protein [Sinorhizobium psoraleae]
MANETTTKTATDEVSSGTKSLKELIAKHRVQTNPAVEAFLDDIKKISAAITDGKFSGRSPVRSEFVQSSENLALPDEKKRSRYSFTLLGEKLEIEGKTEALAALDEMKKAAKNSADEETRAMIEAAYVVAPVGEAPKKRGRKPKDQATV